MTATVSNHELPPVLLDPAASVREARALRNWTQAQRSALALRFATLVAAWRDEWLPVQVGENAQPRVEVFEPDGVWRLASEECAWWSFDEPRRASAGMLAGLHGASPIDTDAASSAMRAIADRMFAMDARSSSVAQGKGGLTGHSLAMTLSRKAWADWMRRLDVFLGAFALKAWTSIDSASAALAAHGWSGALCVRAAWCGGEWTLALPWDAASALLGAEAKGAPRSDPSASSRPQAKTRLDHALADRRVALRVMLEGAQLNLGQIQALRIGDVVPLSHRLDAPILVVGADGQRVCDGWLGQSEGHLAVELAAAAPSAQSPSLASPATISAAMHNIHSSKGSLK